MTDATGPSLEALATIVAAVMAVGAAVFVGLRQEKISAAQAKLAERQTRIEELKLRAELFERRFEIVTQTLNFVRRFPLGLIDLTDYANLTFPDALERSRFLFSAEVYERLARIWEDACDLSSLRDRIARLDFGDPQRVALINQTQSISERFTEFSSYPVRIFGDEVALGAKFD